MQEVHLDKHVKLLDSPGIVMDSGKSDSAVILRNCVKVHICVQGVLLELNSVVMLTLFWSQFNAWLILTISVNWLH